jgi:hypothetical protein
MMEPLTKPLICRVTLVRSLTELVQGSKAMVLLKKFVPLKENEPDWISWVRPAELMAAEIVRIRTK